MDKTLKNESHTLTARLAFKSFAEAQKARDLIKPYCCWVDPKELQSKRFSKEQREKRWDWIYNVVSTNENITSGELFKQYKDYYDVGYKTFQRDIGCLILKGKLKSVVRSVGVGRSSVLSTVPNGNETKI